MAGSRCSIWPHSAQVREVYAGSTCTTGTPAFRDRYHVRVAVGLDAKEASPSVTPIVQVHRLAMGSDGDVVQRRRRSSRPATIADATSRAAAGAAQRSVAVAVAVSGAGTGA